MNKQTDDTRKGRREFNNRRSNKMKRAIIVALLVAGCSDASYPRLESAPNSYTASQVWLAERFGPVSYCWSENANAPGTCTYTRAQCLEVSRARGHGLCQPAGWYR
jgi:hypothetical protein